MSKEIKLGFSEEAKQYWIEKSHEVFKPRWLMEEEKRKVEKILKEQEEKERLYNEKMLFFLLDLERMVM